MLVNASISDLTAEFKKNFSNELRKTSSEAYGTLFYINRSRIRDIAIFLHERGAVFINIFITDIGNKFELIYEYYFKFFKEKKYCFLITEVDKKANEIDSIEIIYPQAKFLEIELTKRYGLKFISFTEEVGEIFVIPKSVRPRDTKLNLLPFGIYNNIHSENNYFHIKVNVDEITGVVEKTGWLYRGIIPLLNRKNIFEDNLRLTKRISYTSSYHHNLAYIMAIEQIADIKVQERVNLLRTLLCEFERYENNLIWFANLLNLLGQKIKYRYLINQRGALLKLYQKYFKCTFLDDLNQIGYNIDIDVDDLKIIQLISEQALPMIYEAVCYYSHKKSVKARCEGIGVLDKKDAIEAGVTGPCLRSSGIIYDVRFEHPYLSYLDKEVCKLWDVVSFTEGDVFARVEVHLWEMKNSCDIINNIIKRLVEDETKIEPYDISQIKLPADKIGIVQVESSQGELSYYVKTADRPGKITLGSIYIATPSLKNFLSLNNYILKNNKESDFSLIIHSMDLNFNDIDL